MPTPDRPGAGVSLADGVYRAVHAAILRGDYRPNQRLVETDIAEELGASRTPVREALQRLGSEGLATKSRHGWLVREFTINEIREIYDIRAALEGYAARLAAQRGDEEQFKQLATLIAEGRRLATRGKTSRATVAEVGDRFHRAVISMAGNERLSGLIASNQTYYFSYQLAARYSDDQLATAVREHERLGEAIRRRDADKAELLARQHILDTLALIETLIDR